MQFKTETERNSAIGVRSRLLRAIISYLQLEEQSVNLINYIWLNVNNYFNNTNKSLIFCWSSEILILYLVTSCSNIDSSWLLFIARDSSRWENSWMS